LRTSPYLNSYPLFKITSVTNEDVISSDPYFFSTVAYDGSAIAMELLGFLDSPSIISVLHDTICKNENYLFPDVSALSNISSDTIHHSLLASAQVGWDSLVITNLVVTDINIGVNQVGVNLTSEETIGSYQWLDCDNGNSIINDETNQFYIPSVTGNYAVEVTLNGCIDTSACYLVAYTGLSDLYNEILSIYPNPAQDVLFIDGIKEISGFRDIEIISATGGLVGRFETAKKEINVLNLPSGVYFVNISHDRGVESIRFVKQ
jgi:hypothetical protein